MDLYNASPENEVNLFIYTAFGSTILENNQPNCKSYSSCSTCSSEANGKDSMFHKNTGCKTWSTCPALMVGEVTNYEVLVQLLLSFPTDVNLKNCPLSRYLHQNLQFSNN